MSTELITIDQWEAENREELQKEFAELKAEDPTLEYDDFIREAWEAYIDRHKE